MNVRRAVAEDYEALAELWREFDHEVPPPTHEGPADVDKELREVAEIIESEIALVAEDEGRPVGFALARNRGSGYGTLTDIYVSRDARRSGIGTELMREVLSALPLPGRDAARPGSARVERRRALAVRALGASGRGHRHDRRDLRPRGEARGAGVVLVRLDPPPVGRSHACGAGGPPVPTADSRRLAWLARRASPKRLDRRLRRGLRPQSGHAAAAGARALEPDGRGRVPPRTRARRARADDPLRAWEHRGRVPLRARVLRPAAAGRRRGSGGQSHRRGQAHRRRTRRGPAHRADGPCAGRPSARPPSCSSALAGALGIQGVEHGWSDAPELPGAVRIERS